MLLIFGAFFFAVRSLAYVHRTEVAMNLENILASSLNLTVSFDVAQDKCRKLGQKNGVVDSGVAEFFNDCIHRALVGDRSI